MPGCGWPGGGGRAGWRRSRAGGDGRALAGEPGAASGRCRGFHRAPDAGRAYLHGKLAGTGASGPGTVRVVVIAGAAGPAMLANPVRLKAQKAWVSLAVGSDRSFCRKGLVAR